MFRGGGAHPPGMGPHRVVMSRGDRVLTPPRTWDIRGVYSSPPDMGSGIQWDTVSKRAVCILLECNLVGNYVYKNNDAIS